MLRIHQLNKVLSSKSIIKDLSLFLNDGSRTAIIGPSGCGKSTLLKLIMGLMSFDSGRIEVNGKYCLPGNSPYQHPSYLPDMGMLFQTAALFDSLSVYENVAFYMRECIKEKDEDKIAHLVAEKLALVEMSGYENVYPSALSGGQKKRVALARTLMKEPKVMLYDEPTTGLDPILSNNIEDLIVSLSEKLKVTTLVITHQYSTIFRTAQQVYFMDEGALLGPEDIRLIKESPYQKIRDFFNAAIE